MDAADELIRNLEAMVPLTEPLLRSIIRSLRLPPGSRGIDIGCGIGVQTLQLAEETRPEGVVTGLDISPAVLEYARQRIERASAAGRVLFQQGDMHGLPFEEGAFDWAWSADCVGYPAGDLLPVLKEMARVVRPGGLIALLAWSSQQVLPGYTLLEARLNANCSAYAPFLEGKPPTSHFQRALHWFPEAGIVKPSYSTIVGSLQGPLPPEVKAAVTALFEMLWGRSLPDASEADADAYETLCSPGSAEFILDRADYCGFFTYSMFTGVVAERT